MLIVPLFFSFVSRYEMLLSYKSDCVEMFGVVVCPIGINPYDRYISFFRMLMFCEKQDAINPVTTTISVSIRFII